MRNRSIPSCAAFVLAVVTTLLSAQVACAQDDFKGTPEGYKETLVQALQQVQQQRWPEAMALFEQAHAMYPNARTLRGLAIVSFESRRYADTLSYGEASVASSERPLNDKQKKHLQGLLEQARSFVGRFQVSLSPPEAELYVSGQAARLESGLLRVDAGQYELVARAPGHVDVVRQLSVRAGQEGRLDLQLPVEAPQPVSVAPVAVPADDAAKTRADEPRHDESRGKRLWTWVAAGTALAVGGAAIGVYVSANGERDDISDACQAMPLGKCTEADRDQRIEDSSIGTKETVSTALLVVSLTAAATAGFLFWFEGRPDRNEPSAAVGLLPGGVQLVGQF
jgi:hypothetical protein